MLPVLCMCFGRYANIATHAHAHLQMSRPGLQYRGGRRRACQNVSLSDAQPGQAMNRQCTQQLVWQPSVSWCLAPPISEHAAAACTAGSEGRSAPTVPVPAGTPGMGPRSKLPSRSSHARLGRAVLSPQAAGRSPVNWLKLCQWHDEGNMALVSVAMWQMSHPRQAG